MMGVSADTRPTVGVPGNDYLDQALQEERDRFRTHILSLESAGFETKEVQVFSDVQQMNELHDALLAAEASSVHAEWYSRYPKRYSTEMADLIKRGEDVSVETMGQAKRHMRRTRASIESVFTSTNIDVLVAPTARGVAPKGIDDDGDPIMNLPWTHGGVPVVSLPLGSTDLGLPIGIACIGQFGRDESFLAQVAYIDDALTV
jgi:Asp-tRNA(Asn)/Glu-tRNA(Gln) amidotransferase A subunit family amidase